MLLCVVRGFSTNLIKMEKLKELKKWCEENSEWQDGMESDGGVYPSMEYIDLYELNKKIDELMSS